MAMPATPMDWRGTTSTATLTLEDAAVSSKITLSPVAKLVGKPVATSIQFVVVTSQLLSTYAFQTSDFGVPVVRVTLITLFTVSLATETFTPPGAVQIGRASC